MIEVVELSRSFGRVQAVRSLSFEARPGARFEGTPSALRLAAPGLGEHTDDLLRELGMDDAEIARHRTDGLVA